MTILQPVYGTPNAIAITTTALASDANLLAGRQSNEVDNAIDDAVDVLLGGTVATTGTPQANTVIELWIWSSFDGGTTRTCGAGAADANFAPATIGSKYLMALALAITQTDTTARTYTFGAISIARLFGGTMPETWGVYVVQNTTTTLGATSLTYTPVKYENV
jgi:hypothetical protein